MKTPPEVPGFFFTQLTAEIRSHPPFSLTSLLPRKSHSHIASFQETLGVIPVTFQSNHYSPCLPSLYTDPIFRHTHALLCPLQQLLLSPSRVSSCTLPYLTIFPAIHFHNYLPNLLHSFTCSLLMILAPLPLSSTVSMSYIQLSSHTPF